MSRPTSGETLPLVDVATLVYELLDAHDDTVRLASAPAGVEAEPAWQAHLDYLRALQRVGREALARATVGDAPA
jgi:hypothetical protein